MVIKAKKYGQHFLATCGATLCVQVAKLCCPYYHPRKQHQDLLPNVEPSSTSCNMLLQLATLKFVARQVACGGGNTGNKALQLAKQQCCATSCKEMLPVLPDLKGWRRLTRITNDEFEKFRLKFSRCANRNNSFMSMQAILNESQIV